MEFERWGDRVADTQKHIPRSVRTGGTKMVEELYGPDWRVPKIEPTLRDVPVIRTAADFRSYQRWMAYVIEHGVEVPGYLLGAEMGLGKTGATLYAMKRLLEKGTITRWLVVAPMRVAEETWPEEISTWDFARDMTFSVITGDKDQRLAAVRREADIHIINRENLPWLNSVCPRWPYDGLVYDEASRLKAGAERTTGGGSGVSRLSEFGTLTRRRYAFKRVVELSGTPSPNGLIDLWGPIYVIDKGQRLGRTRTAFRERWFTYNPKTYQYKPTVDAYDAIMSRIEDVFFSLREEDYLDLPPLVRQDVKVRLPDPVMAKYRKFERDMALSEYNVEAVNTGVLTGKLLQFANGSVYDAEGNDHWVHDTKIEALQEIVGQAGERPILLAYSFRFDLARLRKKFPQARVFGEHRSDKADWDKGRIPLLITHPASAGHGLNFQHGGSIAVWYGLTWSLELYRQFVKRLHRSGQRAAEVLLYHIIALGTMDERLLPSLVAKGTVQDDISDAVRVRMENLR